MTPSFFSSIDRMGDFKTALIEGFGKSLAHGIGGIIFLLMIVLLGGTGILTTQRSPSSSLRSFLDKRNEPAPGS